MDLLPIRRALFSVTDKTGLLPFAGYLHDNGVTLISTGGTFSALRNEGYRLLMVSNVTGFPEILDGRVKTLHPRIHGGILADKDNPEHLRTLEENSIDPIDLVCVNLYDFASAVRGNLAVREAIEKIDVGGPCLIRAAAKNFHSVLVVSSPDDYEAVLDELKNHKMSVSLDLRRRLAAKAFAATSAYDAMIADYLGKR